MTPSPEDAAFFVGVAWGVMGMSVVGAIFALIMTWRAGRADIRDFYGDQYDHRS